MDCLSLLEYSEETGINEGYAKIGKALEGITEKIHLAFLAFVNKPISYIQSDFESFLKLVNVDYADVFIIACCDKMVEYEAVTGENSLLELAKTLREQGKIKFIGFSTHNTEIAHKVISSGEFDVLMYPVNPAFDVLEDEETYNSDILGNIWDRAYEYNSTGKSGIHPRKSVYDACAQNNIGLVAMKPFAGGFIFGVEETAGFTAVNLISYALAQKGISNVVPGCENQGQIEEILTYNTGPDSIRDYSEAVKNSRWSVKGQCLYCCHCMPCPAGIDIAGIFKTKDKDLIQKATSCTKCGECENRCPFDVEIMEKLESFI